MVNTIDNPSIQKSSTDEVETDNDELTPCLSGWTCEKVNSLIGIENDSQQEQFFPNFEEESTLSVEQETGENQQKAKTKKLPSISKNPYMKLGLIALICGCGVIFIGLFLSNAPSFRSEKGTSPQQADAQSKKKTKTPTPEEQIAIYKAEAALSSQSQQLKQMREAADKYHSNEPLPHPVRNEFRTPVRAANNPSTVQLEARATDTPLPTSTTRTIPPSNTLYRGKISYAPGGYVSRVPQRRIKLQPNNFSIPIRQQSIGNSTTLSHSSNLRALPAATNSIDPIKQWQQLALLGSYSAASVPFNAQNTEPSEDDSQGKVLDMSSSNEADNGSISNDKTPVILTSSTGDTEEMQLLGDSVQSGRLIPVGTKIPGEIATSIVWAQGTQQSEPFVVTITEPVRDRNGVEVLPPGTEIVFEVKGVHDSGMVQGNPVAIRINGQEIELAPNVFGLRASGGKPLIAKLRNGAGGELARQDAIGFVVGALGKVGEIVNRPSSTSTSSGYGSFESSSTYNDPNLMGAVLEGGFKPLSEQLLERNKKEIDDLEGRERLWYLKQGTKVQIIVNKSLEL
ncbi:TrbI/VirB10 family protein [Gloeothece verrucosa]|uniref:Conjugation TrbI family protein n=1 Tax=Gloeothece verrucosa (strain PCC 7822) TaxID=497965 RepID=E0UNS6_GLOV7|nr:TrbI/VirB10 family protein [Gloeothece verrucosa]ADN18606.1 hypothetical protein Cyan7822_6968 [Gloeothece verrucosa PCC 7822]